MLKEEEYIALLSDLLNKDPVPKERERRVREANRQLYRAVVDLRGTATQADLALARAALKERAR